MTFVDRLRPFLTQLVTWPVVFIGIWLSNKFGIIIDEATQTAIVTATVGFIYALLKVVFGKWLNPGNAASAHVAADLKEKATLLKETENVVIKNEIDDGI